MGQGKNGEEHIVVFLIRNEQLSWSLPFPPFFKRDGCEEGEARGRGEVATH